MEQLSRTQLYEWILRQDNNIFEYIEDERIRENLLEFEYRNLFFNTLRFNLEILKGIESYFVSSTLNENKSSFSSEDFKSIYQENLMNGLEYFNDIIQTRFYDIEREAYLTFIDGISDITDPYYMFNKLMKQLDKTSNRSLRKFYQNIEANGKGESLDFELRRPQIFLSYASEDRLYTLCLYIYMSSQRINLYVDWLFSDFKKNGVYIKRHLSKALWYSEQFLFLRSLNSELQIKGSYNIKGWCSWEMGNYYRSGYREKYYIELYSRPDTKRKTEGSLQLDGFKKVSSIEHGRLHGV